MASEVLAKAPTPRDRLWRTLGFRYHRGKDPAGTEALKGWMCTDSYLHFGLADRLRLLISGRLEIRLVQHTDVQCEVIANRLDWHIRAPGDRTDLDLKN